MHQFLHDLLDDSRLGTYTRKYEKNIDYWMNFSLVSSDPSKHGILTITVKNDFSLQAI